MNQCTRPVSQVYGSPGAQVSCTLDHTSLPYTGVDLVLVAILAVGLIALGMAMRQLVRESRR